MSASRQAACLATNAAWRCAKISTPAAKPTLLRDAGQEGEQHEGIVIGRGRGADAAPAIVLGRIAAQHVIGRHEIVEAQPLRCLRIVAQHGRAGADVTDR